MCITHRTDEKIMALLRRRSSMKDIAKNVGVSISGVQRVLKMAPVSRLQQFPEVVSFDEFKGNAAGERFQCIVNRRVFDILPTRIVETIQDYLRSFSNRDAAKTFLPNAKIIIDRFHVVRYCAEAMENVRRSFQKALSKAQRRYFKRSKMRLLAHRSRPSEEDRATADVMLRFSDRLLQAYALKEAFCDFIAAPNRNETARLMDFWLEACDRLNFPKFKSYRKMLANWRPYRVNTMR